MKLTTAILLMSPCISSSVFPNTDHYGGDIFAIQNVSSATACSALCEKFSECNLVTWCPDTCYVKNVQTPASLKFNCTSIIKTPTPAKASQSVRLVASSIAAVIFAWLA